jgi:hypothetical protein
MKKFSHTNLIIFSIILCIHLSINLVSAKMKTYEDLAELIKNASTNGIRDFDDEIK